MSVLSTGCLWRAIPKDLLPRSTVNFYFCRRQYGGTLDRLHHALCVRCREKADRDASPTAAIIDSQGVKSAEKGVSIDRPGFDADKESEASDWFPRTAVFASTDVWTGGDPQPRRRKSGCQLPLVPWPPATRR